MANELARRRMKWFHPSMTGTLPPLEPLRAFAEAARRLSFREAAAALGLTPSAVSHRVRTLERWLGQPLFVRGVREISLTRAGRDLARATEAGFARIARVAATLRPDAGRVLKVSALPLFVEAWLIPRLPRLREKHPDLRLAIETSNRVADFRTDGIDVAIRNAVHAPSGLAVRKLIDVRGVVLASKAVAARLASVGDLTAETLIHVSAREGGWRRWLAAAGAPGLTSKGNLIFDSVPASLEAAASGAGVALGLDPIWREAPVAARLIQVFPAIRPVESAYFAVHRKEDAARADLRNFVDWLVAEMLRYRRNPGR